MRAFAKLGDNFQHFSKPNLLHIMLKNVNLITTGLHKQ